MTRGGACRASAWAAGILWPALLAPANPAASADGYPVRPIRLIVPFPPGGGNDLVGRVTARHLGDQLGQQVVVDNRGGAGGVIGAELAARALPDGYTLLLGGTASLSINPGLGKKLPYDAVTDFVAVVLVGTTPNLVVTHPSLPVTGIRDLIALAKARPGRLNFSSAGIGTTPHLAGALFNAMAGVELVHVPYKGSGPAITDLLAGQVKINFSSIAGSLPFVREGRLRGLAVTGPGRSGVVPEIPTVSESGLPGYEVGNWYGILAPATTPGSIVARINGATNRALTAVDLRKRFLELAADPLGGTPEQFAAYTRSERVKWARAIQAADIRAGTP